MIETWNDYQAAAMKTAVYPESARVTYPALGLLEEAGEVAGKIAKAFRDGGDPREAVLKELGDVCWMVAALAHDLGIDLDVSRIGIDTCYATEPSARCVCSLCSDAELAASGALIGDLNKAPMWRVLVCVKRISNSYGATLCDVLEMNLAKLASRAERGVIHGEGDER